MNDNICNVKKQRRQCVVDEGEKAGTIGGLLGKNVFVSTSARLKEKINNNSKIKSYASLTENDDGSVTIKFDYASYLNQ